MKKLFVLVMTVIILLLSSCGNNTANCSNCGGDIQEGDLFCKKCGSDLTDKNDESVGKTDDPKELTQEELISLLGGVLEASCEEVDEYRLLLKYSDFYIEGKIEKAEYDTFFETYEYKLDAGFDSITIHSTNKFVKGDYVYVTVLGLSTNHGVHDEISVSKNKTNEEYLTAEEYFDICKALSRTRFKITGYIFDNPVNIGGEAVCRMYDSEAAYKADKGGYAGIRLAFSEKQENIIGKKIQVMGELLDDGLHNCSIVSD